MSSGVSGVSLMAAEEVGTGGGGVGALVETGEGAVGARAEGGVAGGDGCGGG